MSLLLFSRLRPNPQRCTGRLMQLYILTMISFGFGLIIFKSRMEDPDLKSRQLLQQAHNLFNNQDYAGTRKLLNEVKFTHPSIELNALLCQYKQNPQTIPTVLDKIMDILVTLNVELYKQRFQPPSKGKKSIPRITHELYYWNVIVLSQLLPNPEITELVANQAHHYVESLRTSTSLMILYQMLKIMEQNSRLTSCISLIEKQNRLLGRVKKLTKEEQAYRFMNQILFCKVLLKLGMIDGGRITYMMKFNQSLENTKEDELTQISGLHISIHQQLLHAEIEYHAKNYPQSLKILSELIPKLDNLGKSKELIKNIIDHNVALILLSYKQSASSQLTIHKTLNYFSKCEDFKFNNERYQFVEKCKDNLLIALLTMSNDNYQGAYQALKNHHNCYSYKLNYRKAQLCLNYYHELLKNPSRVLTYEQMHDFYETVYYYPNLPYFQQKSKNKNPNYTNKKFFYRRYVLPQQQNPPKETFNIVEELEKAQSLNSKTQNGSSQHNDKRKDPSKQKKEPSKGKKAPRKSEEPKPDPIKEQPEPVSDPQVKIRQILEMSEWFLKEALLVLQKEKSIIVNLEQEEKGLTEQVNEKLYSEYISFKSSIYCLLCYVHLCKHEWAQTIHYASLYQAFQKQYQLQIKKNSPEQQIHYNILTYKTEAYFQLNKADRAYDLLHTIVTSIDYSDNSQINCRTSTSQKPGLTYFEKMTQFNNFGFNLSVLHSRDNKIPEAYNSIQKLLQQMRVIPTNPQANLPLSLIELLIHYNLRTSNQHSAVQLVKRRRILNLPGVISHYHPTLNITK